MRDGRVTLPPSTTDIPCMAMRKPFLDLVRERVVVLDGAMGANLQTRQFDLMSAGTIPVDRLVSDASVADYAGLLLPGLAHFFDGNGLDQLGRSVGRATP